MGETDQIESELENRRDELQANLEELENKVRLVADWRYRFRKNPALLTGVAFGTGLLLASLLGRPRGRREYRLTRPERHPSAAGKTQLRGVWDDIQGALIGVLATGVTNTLAGAMPGFAEHFRSAARRSSGNGVHGEDDYEGARRYRRDLGRFVRSADIERAARAAQPQNESEADEMVAAETAGRARAKPS
jgi:hypothetical protein